MAPCTEWITLEDVESEPDAAGLDPPLLARAITDASEILYRLSGRQFAGVCHDVVRPCQRWYRSEYGAPPSWWRWISTWGEYVVGQPGERRGGIEVLSEITLGAYPIREITEVRIDGAVLSPSAYRVDDRRWLKRIDGKTWPILQRLDLDPLVDKDTFQVSFTYGQAPPDSGVDACRVFAIELAKGMSGDANNLPQRVLNVSLQGVSYTLLDPLLFLDKGRTGIYYVDLFLASVNPRGLKRRPSVISPDIPRPVRRTGVTPGS